MPRRAILETVAALATGIVHIVVFEATGTRGPFIVVALLGWGAYIALRVVRDRQILAVWGLRRAGLRETILVVGAITLVGAGAMAGYGAVRGELLVNPHLMYLLLLYPIWGLVQQFLVQAMAVRHLRAVMPAVLTVLAAGLLFGLAHLPDLALFGATFGLGVALTPVYLRWRNLWALGVCHGWLGALFYFWVLGSDPLAQIS